MKRIMSLIIAIVLTAPVSGWALTGNEILDKIDRNLVVDQAVSISRMIIHGRTGTRSITSKAWTKGNDKSLVEYLSPAREKGKKMLRLKNKIWNYTPEPHDRIITISGHLLRQSVMGSDLSYEELTENKKLQDNYDSVVEGTENINGRNTYVLTLTANNPKVAYYKRKLWVDSERWLPIKQELFAKSGRLLKKVEITEAFQVEGRWYPKKMIFKDMLSRGKGTEFIMEEIDFNVDIPDYKFTKAALRK